MQIRCTFIVITLLVCGLHATAQDRIRIAELTPEAEAAIDRGLRHLAKTQNPDGSWDTANPVGVTSLALMAFMVKGYFPDQEPYGEVMSRGVDYLLRSAQVGKGYLGKSMYDHGLATLALSEVWGESARSDEIREALRQAVAVIVKSQSTQGGWRYQPDGRDQDISITVIQIVGLASAKEAGILVPDDTIARAIKYVKYCQFSSGAFGYRGPFADHVTQQYPPLARTAAGTLSLQLCGERDDKQTQAGLQFLRSMTNNKFNSAYPWFYYGHYYAVQAMYQSGEADYQSWYLPLRDTLLKTQQADGSWRGGIPEGSRLTVQTDRDTYCTPMAVLILGVPYRFLPIYQR